MIDQDAIDLAASIVPVFSDDLSRVIDPVERNFTWKGRARHVERGETVGWLGLCVSR
jgi:hypothetical protein